MLKEKRVFGQNEIYSLQTYFEYVRRGRDDGLDIKVAGPSYYNNQMFLEGFEEEELLKIFSNGILITKVEELTGCSCIAFYQYAEIIGFQRI